jgi:hypothetical protein
MLTRSALPASRVAERIVGRGIFEGVWWVVVLGTFILGFRSEIDFGRATQVLELDKNKSRLRVRSPPGI